MPGFQVLIAGHAQLEAFHWKALGDLLCSHLHCCRALLFSPDTVKGLFWWEVEGTRCEPSGVELDS